MRSAARYPPMSTLPHKPVQARNMRKQQLEQLITTAFCLGVVGIQSIRQRILFAFMHRFREGPQWLSGLPAGSGQREGSDPS